MELLFDITIIIVISVAAALVCHRLHVPSITGFLLTGVVAGPHVLGLVSAAGQIERLAEVGVVLLLFVIGLEISVTGLLSTWRQFLAGGSIQLFGTAVLVGLATYFCLGTNLVQSGFLGVVVALSSTAIVLRLLQERAELDSPHGRMVLGTLIYQDIAVVPLMLAAPLLAGASGAAGASSVGLGALLLRVAAVGFGAWIAYRWLVPWLLFRIARTQSREAFLLGVLGICSTIALLTQEAGLSLALGAFLAGLIISESEYSHQAVGVILPFRDVFMCLFFVSVGMLLDVGYLLQHPLLIAALTLGVLVMKPLVGAGAALALGLPLRSAVLAGMALGQVGEFSLVAVQAGVSAGLLVPEHFQMVLDTAVLSMLAAPALFAVAPRLAESLQRLPRSGRMRLGGGSARLSSAHHYERHIVIVGFGVTGRNVARAAIEAGVDYAAIDINAETVRSERRAGMRLHYGDATTDAILHHVNVDKALVVVVAVSDPAAARRITELSRRIAPGAFILVRSRYLKEIEALHALGADEVIADELEVSIEIFSRVLARCLVPREEIERFVDDVRAEWRVMARSLSAEATGMHDLRVEIPDLATHSIRLTAASPLAGSTIAESGLRANYGVTVLAVKRDDKPIGNPMGATRLVVGDVLFVVGPRGWDPKSVA